MQLSLRYWTSQQLCFVDCKEKLGMVLVPESSIWMLHWTYSWPLSNSMINLSILACCVLGPYPAALVQSIQWHLQLPSIHDLFSKVHFSLQFSMLSHSLSAPQLHICQEYITVDPPPSWMFHGFYWVDGLSFPLLACGLLPRIHKQKNILYAKPGYQITKQQIVPISYSENNVIDKQFLIMNKGGCQTSWSTRDRQLHKTCAWRCEDPWYPLWKSHYCLPFVTLLVCNHACYCLLQFIIKSTWKRTQFSCYRNLNSGSTSKKHTLNLRSSSESEALEQIVTQAPWLILLLLASKIYSQVSSFYLTFVALAVWEEQKERTLQE